MITFSKKAIAKYLFVRDYCNETNLKEKSNSNAFLECSVLGISSPDRINYVDDVIIPKQEVTGTTTDIDQDWLHEWADEMWDKGEDHAPKYTTRIWCHTHPGSSAEPSGTDEKTWSDTYMIDGVDWAAMIIIAQAVSSKNEHTYCRAKYESSIGMQVSRIGLNIDYDGKLVPIDYIYDMQENIINLNKTYEKYGFSSKLPLQITDSLYKEYNGEHQKWFDELASMVTKKSFIVAGSYYGSYSPNNNNNNNNNKQIGFNNNNSNTLFDNEKKREKTNGNKRNNQGSKGKSVDNTDSKTESSLDLKEYIRILVDTENDNINSFDISERNNIAKLLETSVHELYLAQKFLKDKGEEHGSELMHIVLQHYPEIISDDTFQYNKDFPKKDLVEICYIYDLLPSRLEELCEDFISDIHFMGSDFS